MSEPNPSSGAMRLLGGLAIGVLALAIVGILAISAGLFDPFPAELDVAPRAPEDLHPAAGERTLRAEAELPTGSEADIRLWAAADGGPMAYGAWLGTMERHLAAAVTTEGYLAVWLHEQEADGMLIGWRPWPHVQPGAQTNEIRLARQGERISVWVNREWLWEGEVPGLGDQVGILAEALDPTAPVSAAVRFLNLEIASN